MVCTGVQEFERRDHKFKVSLKLHSKTLCQPKGCVRMDGEGALSVSCRNKWSKEKVRLQRYEAGG